MARLFGKAPAPDAALPSAPEPQSEPVVAAEPMADVKVAKEPETPPAAVPEVVAVEPEATIDPEQPSIDPAPAIQSEPEPVYFTSSRRRGGFHG